jgi:hypothetical protein
MRLPGLPGSAQFMEAYAAAMESVTERKIEIGASRAKAGTVGATVGLYLASAEFAALAHETRRTRRNVLERLREAHGEKRIAMIEQKHVRAMVDAKAATPSAARNLLQVLRVLMAFSIKAGIRTDDPTVNVTHAKIKTDGYPTWEEEDIERDIRSVRGAGSRWRCCSAPGNGAATSFAWDASMSGVT